MPPNQRSLAANSVSVAAVHCYAEMLEQGVKKSELARRLGWHMPQLN